MDRKIIITCQQESGKLMIIKGTEKNSNDCWNALALQGRHVDYNTVCSGDDKLTLPAVITTQTQLSRLNFYEQRVNPNVTKNKSITTSNNLKF